ncbi:hypothetical protein KUTeg_018730 [Tegillarca granosa]|uniref:Chromo domain-containing protein n=1 Tax=Tegillarca granosa TaxID=220873 RepID=A0ABQ9EJQ2_TEGGR|nr:hypothetical protein KUTeg_018730 [Tegillarca granosa]
MAPSEVNKENENEVRNKISLNNTKRLVPKKKMKTKKRKKSIFKFKVNDPVRITFLKHPFRREYHQNGRAKFLKLVIDIKGRDFNNDPISGTFYTQELQKSNKDENTLWKVHKILKERTVNNEKQIFVSWLHWPSKFNSWIKKSDHQRI